MNRDETLREVARKLRLALALIEEMTDERPAASCAHQPCGAMLDPPCDCAGSTRLRECLRAIVPGYARARRSVR